MNPGYAATLTAFGIWGLIPLFWRLLAGVPVGQVMAHRIVFGFVGAAAVLLATRGSGFLRDVTRKTFPVLVLSSVLMATNGGFYVYGVHSHQVVATSLGYFINPLLNVALGVVILRERLTARGWFAVTLATLGVAYLSYRAGTVPWLSLVLASTFGTYGLVRKIVAIEALPGLAIETLLLSPFAIAYLAWAEAHGTGAFGHGLRPSVLLALTGPFTALSLALFAYGARRVPYSTVGILQFLAPTLQLGCAVFAFGEPFTRDHAVGFGFIWAGLVVYAVDGVLRSRAATPAAVEATA